MLGHAGGRSKPVGPIRASARERSNFSVHRAATCCNYASPASGRGRGESESVHRMRQRCAVSACAWCRQCRAEMYLYTYDYDRLLAVLKGFLRTVFLLDKVLDCNIIRLSDTYNRCLEENVFLDVG